MGRSRKLTENKKGRISNEEKEARQESERLISELTPISITPPDWLDDIAKAEYKRIVPLLKELPVASLDLSLVSAYCQAYSDYQQANERLKDEPAIIETAHGTKINQNHTIKRDSFNVINSITPKLGMTIDSRLKIFTPKKEEQKEDVLGDMLNGK